MSAGHSDSSAALAEWLDDDHFARRSGRSGGFNRANQAAEVNKIEAFSGRGGGDGGGGGGGVDDRGQGAGGARAGRDGGGVVDELGRDRVEDAFMNSEGREEYAQWAAACRPGVAGNYGGGDRGSFGGTDLFGVAGGAAAAASGEPDTPPFASPVLAEPPTRKTSVTAPGGGGGGRFQQMTAIERRLLMSYETLDYDTSYSVVDVTARREQKQRLKATRRQWMGLRGLLNPTAVATWGSFAGRYLILLVLVVRFYMPYEIGY